MIHGVEGVGHWAGVRVLEVIEGGVERQASAHPQEHASAQTIAGGPEVVATVPGILQVLGHGLDLLFRLEGGQLQAQRSAILIGEEVVELGRVRIHSADKVLDAIQLNGCDTLTWRKTYKREEEEDGIVSTKQFTR